MAIESLSSDIFIPEPLRTNTYFVAAAVYGEGEKARCLRVGYYQPTREEATDWLTRFQAGEFGPISSLSNPSRYTVLEITDTLGRDIREA